MENRQRVKLKHKVSTIYECHKQQEAKHAAGKWTEFVTTWCNV